MANKSTLDNVLKAVLSVGNAEQNFGYAPYVFDNHFNIVTSFLIDNLVMVYPKFVDVLLPFLVKEVLTASNGEVKLPDEYRNIIGVPSINVNKQGKDCSDNNPVIIDTEAEFNSAKLKAGCQTYPLTIVEKALWDDRTTSKYAFPTHTEPISMYVGKKLKVCPYDIGRVEILYVKKEKLYKYGYITQPDDTYLFDVNSSVESEWDNAAFDLLFRGVYALYSAYSRDPAMTDYSQVLNKAGLF